METQMAVNKDELRFRVASGLGDLYFRFRVNRFKKF